MDFSPQTHSIERVQEQCMRSNTACRTAVAIQATNEQDRASSLDAGVCSSGRFVSAYTHRGKKTFHIYHERQAQSNSAPHCVLSKAFPSVY